MLDINNYKGLMAHIYLRNSNAVLGLHDESLFGDGDVIALSKFYEQQCADALIIFDLSRTEEEHAKHIAIITKLNSELKIPIIAGGHIYGLDNVDQLLRAGCNHVFLNMSKQSNLDLLESASKTFGRDVIAVCINEFSTIAEEKDLFQKHASFALLFGDDHHLYDAVRSMPLQCIPLLENMDLRHIMVLMHDPNVMGISGEVVSNKNVDLYAMKEQLMNAGIQMHYRQAMLNWNELKLNSDGLLPVVVQDYKNNQVLMMAYMNEEAYNKTVRSGRMTYWSRSRQSLWLKGETSGHYQLVKELFIDCDNDTLLAKVEQIGAACHTGNRTCFYRSILKNPYHESDVVTLLDTIYKKAKDDRTEQDHDTVLHDTTNLLYHLTNLMAKNDVTWDEVTSNLYEREKRK